jgi:hypothetical protein
MPLIVTNCTARKRGARAALVLDASHLGGELKTTVANWRSAASRAAVCRPAAELYTGRSIVEVRRAAHSAQARLYFASAGMGLVAAQDMIPVYDLTPVRAAGGLAAALREHNASSSDWWCAISGNGLSRLIRSCLEDQVLVALPATYLQMIASDLKRLSPGDAARVRIFTSSAGAKVVPDFLQSNVMPYDERLESIPGFAGTRADFPQRALRHFVEQLNGVAHAAHECRVLVDRALSSYSVRKVPERRRLDDNQVKALISSRWDSCDGRSAQLLRALRDEEAVACEQARFAQLWREVRAQMTGAPVA